MLVACGALFCSSCTQRIADLTFMSTKNVDMNHAPGYRTDSNHRVEGKDVGHMIVVFPTRLPNAKEAIDKAIEQSGSDCVGLSNMKLEHSFWYIPYVYGRETFTATGDPVYKR